MREVINVRQQNAVARPLPSRNDMWRKSPTSDCFKVGSQRDFRYSSPVSPLRNKIIAPPIIDRDIGEGTRRQ
jgi:hypothetical protein